MTKQFHYALDALLDEYEKQHGKKLKKIQIYEDTGISRTAINRMLDRDTRRADLDTLWTLVTYLRKELGRKVTLDDLLPYKESEDDQKQK